jgi:hypothetical protein
MTKANEIAEAADPLLGETWDLREVVAERDQPKESVSIYLNEVASYAKGELLLELVRAKKNEKVLNVLNEQLEKVEKDLEATRYTVHITAIPSRMREDIASKAMHEHPMKIDLMGRDDPATVMARIAREQDLLWLAQIYDVVNPRGQHKADWAEETLKEFRDALPTGAQKAIDAAIKSLTVKAEEYSVASKSVDF